MLLFTVNSEYTLDSTHIMQIYSCTLINSSKYCTIFYNLMHHKVLKIYLKISAFMINYVNVSVHDNKAGTS